MMIYSQFWLKSKILFICHHPFGFDRLISSPGREEVKLNRLSEEEHEGINWHLNKRDPVT